VTADAPRRRVTVERFDALEAKVDEILGILRRLDSTPPAPTEVLTRPDGAVFLPGTGWLRAAAEESRTPEALAALEQLRRRDDDA
jgi:hypothetical protein